MRLIDADATVKYLREFRCEDCDRRKGMMNGKTRFIYEIGDAPCRACDIGDTIDYFLNEDISPTIDVVPVVYCKDCKWNSATPHNPLCQKDCNAHEPYWFCADGEVKIAKNDEKIVKYGANVSIDERITPREIPLKF